MAANYADERKRLAGRLKQYHDWNFTPGVYEHSIFGYAAKLLEVDAVEVVHGWWEQETPFSSVCSVCNHHRYGLANEPYQNYCPNCGAKMDGR